MNEALATASRPHSFAEVIGQPTIISILSSQIANNTFKQAYIFTGPPGTGKTTVARIMANSINNNEGSPIEFDGASNNGVDNIRQIIIDAQQMSLDAEYKVYIIDECHQLTKAAWDAALKLIEEPPINTIFIFCTTNPNKIPDTILSRVQRFDFKRVNTSLIVDRLAFILNTKFPSIQYDMEALYQIAARANGVVREALSQLDKCISSTQALTVDNVSKILGIIKYSELFKYLQAILNKDYSTATTVLQTLYSQETSPINVIDAILNYAISCEKYFKTGDLALSNLPDTQKAVLANITVDLLPIIERIFKYRQLCVEYNSMELLDILTLELCRG